MQLKDRLCGEAGHEERSRRVIIGDDDAMRPRAVLATTHPRARPSASDWKALPHLPPHGQIGLACVLLKAPSIHSTAVRSICKAPRR